MTPMNGFSVAFSSMSLRVLPAIFLRLELRSSNPNKKTERPPSTVSRETRLNSPGFACIPSSDFIMLGKEKPFTKILGKPILADMKRTLVIALISLFSFAPAFAGAYYKSKPCPVEHTCEKKECCMKKCCKSAGEGLLWVVKLPFRVLASASAGVYGLLADQDFDGFEDGYNVI